MSLQLTKPKISPAANAILRAQDQDARCVTLPNTCYKSVVELDKNKFVRCFSVSLQRANQLPPDKWDLVKLPCKLPPLSVGKNKNTDLDHILVDHISIGLLQNNRLQAVIGKDNCLEAMKMFPPHEEDDSNEHWATVASQLMAARRKLAISKE